jgi:LysM repeat protein
VQRLRSPIEPFIYEQEIHSGISIDENSDQFVGHALMQSDLVTSLEPIPAARPAETVSSNSIRSVSYIDCRSGSRPASPSDYDLIGSATEGTGLFALEQAECIDLVCLFSAAPKEDLGPVAILAADRYCRSRQALLLVDPPLDWMSVTDVVTGRHPPGFSSPNLLTYFPRLAAKSGVVPTPVSAMGALAGVLAARDRRVGRVSGTPGELFFKRGAYKPAVNLTANDIQSLARLGINSLVRAPRLHVRVEGEVTLARYSSITSEWGELHLRRKALFILGSISSSTNWLAFQENESPVWQEIGEQLHPFMKSLHEKGYLAGDSPSNAYFVKCDSDSNFGLTGRKGEFAFIVGFALRKSGDHQAFRFSHRDGACTISELGWRAGLALAS